MKIFLSSFCVILAHLVTICQPAQMFPEFDFAKEEFENHLQFIASDSLAGRRTASAGEEIAARYMISLLEQYGVKPAPGSDHFRQAIPFVSVTPPASAKLVLGDSEYLNQENLLILQGEPGQVKSGAVFAGHGWVDEDSGIDDYKGLDVRGKIVFVLPGRPGGKSPGEIFEAMQIKKDLAAERGVAALIELYRLNFPWSFFTSYFGKERLEMASSKNEDKTSSLVYGWLKEGAPNPIKDLEKGKSMLASLTNSGAKEVKQNAHNLVGIVEGNDPILKNEYILVSAHYDHVGVGQQGGAAFTPQDSIFNGARDNGIGTVALLSAAKAIAAKPAKRSVIFLACTGEEMGLLGSRYYVENPLVPLENVVCNINNDGAGYNSTKHVTIIGLEKTNVTPVLEKGAAAFGFQIAPDPAPEQNLYERSDNANFAKKGIPAVNFSPGITEMTDEVFKYYHQAIDNPDSVDYDYLIQFWKTFAHTVRLIADMETQPSWLPGHERSRN